MFKGDKRIPCPPKVYKTKQSGLFCITIYEEENTMMSKFKTEQEAEEFLQGYQLAYKLQYGGRVKINGKYHISRRTKN